jgi:hypothetical protein
MFSYNKILKEIHLIKLTTFQKQLTYRLNILLPTSPMEIREKVASVVIKGFKYQSFSPLPCQGHLMFSFRSISGRGGVTLHIDPVLACVSAHTSTKY